MKRHRTWHKTIVLFLSLMIPMVASAQQQAVGVVTALKGQAQLTRAGAQTALRFKNDVALRDFINTREKSLTRILFGGKSTVTVRELSQLEVREETLPTGAVRSIHELSSGAILVNVVKGLLRPGDEVQIRTPNAVAAVRGSTILVQYIVGLVLAETIITIISGSADITPVTQLPRVLSTLRQIIITGTQATGIDIRTETITRSAANAMVQTFQMGPIITRENTEQTAQDQIDQASRLTDIVLESVERTPLPTFPTPKINCFLCENIAQSSEPAPSKGFIITFDPVFPSIPAGVTVQYFDGGLTGPLAALPAPNAVPLTPSPFGSAIPGGGNALLLNFDVLPFGPFGALLTFDSLQQTVTAVGNDFGGDPIFDNEVVSLTAFDSGGAVIGSSTFASPFVDVANLKPVRFTSGSADIKFAAFTFENDLGFYLVDDIDPPAAPGFSSLELSNSSVTTIASAEPFIQLSGATVDTEGSLVSIHDNSTFNLGGTLLSATDSDLTIDGSLLGIFDGGRLTTGSDDPLVLLDGGTHRIGEALFDLSGVDTDPVTGLGTEQPISGAGPIGALFRATNGADIEVGGSAVRLDTALLEATLPVLDLAGSAGAESTLTTNADTIDIVKSKVVSQGPVVALNRGLINVTDGALINLSSGSNWNVAGDLLRLTNGSKINVINGPLIRVDGVSPTGSASRLDVGGALVNFGGTGGNRIVVSNAIAPTANPGGLPVSATGGGSVNIGPNPVKNPGLGSITVNGGGSLIQASNGGTVNIAAP